MVTRSSTVPLLESRLRGTTAILAALLAAAAFAAPRLVPFAAPLALVAGAPIAIERIRMGAPSAALAAALAASLVAAVVGPPQAFVFLLFQAAPGFLIGEAVARERGLRRGCGWAFGLLFAEIVCLLVALGPAVPASVAEVFAQAATPEALSALRESGMSAESIETWTEQWKAAAKVATVIYPGAAVVFACLVVLAQAAVVRFFVARHQPSLLEGDSFESLRLPPGIVVLFLLAGPAVFFEPLRPFAYNALLVLGFFFALQGFAIALYFVRRMAGPPLLRALLLLLVLIPAWSPYLLALTGFFDTWFDLRRFAEPRPEA